MKVLVTGGAGFIGSHIVDALISQERKVSVIDNISTGRKAYVNSKARLYTADITDEREICRIFAKEKPSIVIHAAGQVMLRKSIEEPALDAKINIIGTINVLEACRKNLVKKIIYTSTGGARVGEPEYLPVDEGHPVNPLSPYGISKHTAEHYVWTYNKLYGLDYLIFCFGNVYGPRDEPVSGRVISQFASMMLEGRQPVIYGDGEQTRDFIYVLDLAEFIAGCIDKNPKHRLFLLANGEKISINGIFQRLKKISSFEKDAIHKKAVNGEVKDMVLCTSLAQRELGWKPVHSMDSGLRETFEWMKRNIR